MTIGEMHWTVKQRANRLDSQHYKDLLPVQLDERINSAQLWVLHHYTAFNQPGFEAGQMRKDLFATLVVKYPVQPELKPVTEVENTYEFRLSELRFDYAHLIRCWATCGNKPVAVIMVKHDELTAMLNDAFQKPSKSWKRLLGTIGMASAPDDYPSLYIHAPATHNLQGLRVEYIKAPQNVFYGGYDSPAFLDCQRIGTADCAKFDNINTPPRTSDFPQIYHDFICDVAAWLITGKTENMVLMQILQQKISSTS